MDSLQFCYWLKGYFELTDSEQQMSAQQVQIVKDHLDLVFTKVTPNYTLPLTSISSIPFYPYIGDEIKDGLPKPIEYCGMPPEVITTGIVPSWEEAIKQVDEYGVGSLGTVGYFRNNIGVTVPASQYEAYYNNPQASC